MSAESELRAVLIADAALLAGIGTVDGMAAADRISIDAIAATTPRPFIAFSKQSRTDENGLDGTPLAVVSQIDLQVVGTTRPNGIVIAGLVRDALRAAGMPSDRGGAGYDPDNGLEVEVVTVDWFDV